MGTNAVRQNDLSVQPLPAIASEALKTQNESLSATGSLSTHDKQVKVTKGNTPLTKETFQSTIIDGSRLAVRKFMSELTTVIAREMQRANNGEQRIVTQLKAQFEAITQQLNDVAKQVGDLKAENTKLKQQLAAAEQKAAVPAGEVDNGIPPAPPLSDHPDYDKTTGTIRGSESTSSENLKMFPKNGTADQKLKFVTDLLDKNISLKEIAERINEESKKDKTDSLVKLAGGGHGNVLLILGTPHVIKVGIQGSEKRTLKFLHDLKALKEKVGDKKVTASEVEAVRSDMVRKNKDAFADEMMKSSPESLAKSLNNYEHIDATFSVPIDIGIKGDYAVFPNANPNLANDELNAKGSILDIKTGYDIVSRHELALNGAESKTTGLAWLRKKIVTRLIPYLKGTNARGYEVVSDKDHFQSKIPVIGKVLTTAGKFIQRFINGRNSDTYIKSELKELTAEQKSELKRLADSAKIALESLPFSMTGSSAMIHVPDNQPDPKDEPPKKTGQVGLKFGDFAHVVFEHQVDKMNVSKGKDGLPSEGFGIREDKFVQLKNNSISGFNNVSKLL